MNVFLKYNFEKMCRAVLDSQLADIGVTYVIASSGIISFPLGIPMKKYNLLVEEFSKYGIEIVDDHKAILVQRIKSLITDMLHKDSALPMVKISSYLADSLNENYRTLAQVFSETCHISIESFIIFHKIELVKQLLLQESMTLTEISHRLNYSSVAHLSNQFKNVTGLSPSAFQKLSEGKKKLKVIIN
jgi:AraC-like DNA-binding protein